MDYKERNEIIINTNDNKNYSEELIIFYYFKCCSCNVIFMTVILSLVFFFPFLFFIYYCGKPYKKVIIIDQKKKVLILCDKGMIPCCKLNSNSFNINDIKKLIIYETVLYNLYNKRNTINIYFISANNEKKFLFYLEYDNKEKLEEILQFFRKYFNTEYIPIKKEGDNKNYNHYEGINNQMINSNNNDYNNLNNEDNIITKPPINEDAALPVFA